ncbi:MAG TPA: GatB/YqeY domain-containing protein [Bacteroidales bacterium]|nr:GatB/YqeY domain-containing protein [Bacteroidales bacterium]
MSIQNQIDQDIKQAMLAKEKDKLVALRAIKSALLLAKTEKRHTELSEEAEIKLLQKLVKQRKESAEIYQQQGRNDLANKELEEAKIIGNYLPEQISDEELTGLIKVIIDEVGASTMADMGKVMGIANKKLAGKAEGKAIADKVKSLLNK